MLLVDGWESLAEGLERVDHGRGLDALLGLVRDGEQAGLRLVAAGGRGVLASRIGSLVGQRLLLRPTDPTDLLLAGVPTSAIPSRLPPGRAIHLPSGHQVQLVRSDDPEQVLRHARGVTPPLCRPPERALRLRRLPDVVRRSEIEAWDGPGVLLGVGGDEAHPVVLDLAAHRRLVVLGPGRQRALARAQAIAQQLHDQGRRVLAVAPLGGPLGEGGWPVVGDAGELLEGLGRSRARRPRSGRGRRLRPGGRRRGRRARPRAVPRARAAGQGARPHSLVLAVRTDAGHLPIAPPFLTAALRHRTGVLLNPRSPHDGEPFGVRVEPADPAVPGRGVWIARGVPTTLQVAL